MAVRLQEELREARETPLRMMGHLYIYPGGDTLSTDVVNSGSRLHLHPRFEQHPPAMDPAIANLLAYPYDEHDLNRASTYLQTLKDRLELSIKIANIEATLEQTERDEEERQQEDVAMAEYREQRRPRAEWARKWLLRRETFGHWEQLVQELMDEDRSSFRNYHRVDVRMFEEILVRITPHIQKQQTFFRKPLPPGLRLSATLRYLATGESFVSLAYNYRIGGNTMCLVIHETCQAILQEFQDESLPCHTTPDGWKKVADGFESRWNLPHCVGAIDGKHIAIKCPAGGGSYYFNYKGFHSIVMMALVDAHHRFLYVDVGANGAVSDGGLFQETDLRESLEQNTIGLPPQEPLPGGTADIPYYIVGDDAFPLKEWLMKPYPKRSLTREQRIFNYRLSRARLAVENAFGILAHR